MKHLIGLAAFVLAITTGVGLTTYFRPRRPDLPPAPTPGPRVADDDATAPPQPERSVAARVRQCTLDRRSRQSVATLALEAPPGAPTPASVSVTIYIFVPNGGPVFAAAPVVVKWPDAGSTIEVRTPAPWVGSSSDPGSGYFARVVVTTAPAHAQMSHVDTSVAGAAPVLVIGDHQPR